VASTLTIREALLEDAPKLLPLLEQLGYPQALAAIRERLDRYQACQDHFVFVADLNSTIVGFVSIAAIESFVYEGRMYRVTALAVDQSIRRKGIGKALMSYIEEFAKRNQGKIIDLTSGLRRAADGSHHFYKALGYENEGYMAKLYLRKEI
jgi:GNAT superfamily N-acetyltransferase